MPQIPPSELIINDRGAVYHINTRPEELAKTIITVGDPDRVASVSKHFDSIEFTNQHREFICHTGYLNKKRITCISTGIGPDNVDIVLNELDALHNIDLETRMVKNELTSLNIIRIGTSGSLQEEIPVDSFVASTHGLGLDNLLHFYRIQNNDEEKSILQAFNMHTGMNESKSTPYLSMASPHLLKHFATNFHQGITVTCPGFYGPQGRVLRMGLAYPNLVNALTKFSFGKHRITNFEMETSAIYGMGKILNHHCISLSAIVANRVAKTFSQDAGKSVEELITKTLNVIADSSI